MCRLKDAASVLHPEHRRGGTVAHLKKPQAWLCSDLTTTLVPVRMTQRTIGVDERIAVMRSQIAERLPHAQRLNLLDRGMSDASAVLNLIISALAQLREVQQTMLAWGRAS
jgi:hypothetical protein